jgi:chorismate mutase
VIANEQSADPVVTGLRERISAEDRAILEAVNRRLELVAELWRHKAVAGHDVSDPHREARMLAELRAANTGPLSAEGVERLLQALLELTRDEVR